ncbi:MAG: ATP-binding cassette, subfamily multidrug efflux pump [Acidobacteriota bacterium]|jgi:ATP-binding cassette subfamily B protein|nr:ATP-binding cassette, subfamily multidrug efflux pump [Acidobacteriota bacterium]
MPKPHHNETALGDAGETRLVHRLLGYVAPYKGYAVTSLAMTLLNAPLMLAGPPLTKAAVDLFIAPEQARQLIGYEYLIKRGAEAIGLGGSAYSGLVFIGLLFLLANALAFAMQYAHDILMQSMGQYVMYDLRMEIFSHLQRLPVKFHDRNPVGRLMTRLTSDVDALNEMFTVGIVSIFRNAIILLYILGWMIYVNWRLTLVSFAILPLLIGATVWFRRGVRRANAEVRVHVARINAFLQEHIGGMSIVQLFNREETERRLFADINTENRQANLRALFFTSVFQPGVELIGAIGVALILWYGGVEILVGAATIGMLVAFIQLVNAFYQPISDISEKYNVVQAAVVSSERIFELLDEPVEIQTPARVRPPAAARGKIEFRNVWFAYEGENWVLKDVSFVVQPGESAAFVGHTGAGKTTVTSLLLRFYEIQRGQILLDDVDIREMDVEKLRSNFGIVLQDVCLYAGDIAGNIRLGNASIGDEQVRAAAESVHADTFIKRLPEGYATQLNERGAGLSTGQKQLISFARALAFNPRVLIFDEATSSVDTETEALIRDAVSRLIKCRTSIAVAHRLSTIQSADKIIVMHKGEVRESGTHQELLLRRKLYWRLYQLQFGYDVSPSGEREVGELV